MRRVLSIVFILLLGSSAFSQTQSDICHVYLVDVAKAKAGYRPYRDRGDLSALSAAQTVFPEFHPAIGEEELTTKTYRFPRTRLVITASVYYTDESMASAGGSDSMLLGIVVSPKAQQDAISAESNAVTEITQSLNPHTVRTKKYLRVNGRLYLVGLECRCNERPASK